MNIRPPLDVLAPLGHSRGAHHTSLTMITAAERATIPTPEGLIPITVNEQRRLIDTLTLRPHGSLVRLLHWSTWRRRRQARVRLCRYQLREQSP